MTENLESIRKRVDKEKSSMQRHRAVVFFTTSLLVFLAAAVCYQLFREDIGLRLFLQRKHDCAQIEEKMLGFLKAGRVDLAESLMTELQNCDKGKIRSPYEIEKLVLLIRSLREKDRDAAARQLTNLRDSWLDASLDKALADRQNQEKMMLNKLIELKLASLGPARKNSSYRKQLYQLISKMYLLRQEILDPSVGEKMIKSYLYSVGPADEIPGQELMEVYCFDVRISAAKGKDALAEIKKIRAELERRWGKGNVWYVKFISNACGLLKPDEFERVLLEALALERQGVGTTEMESTLNSLARNYASLRKHELSLRYYKEALSLSLENIENGKMQSDFYLDSSNSIPAGKLISVLHGLCSCCIECLALNDRRVAEDYFNRAVATFDQITISQTEERVEGVGAAKALMGAAISMAQFERGAAAVSRLIKRGRKMDNDDMRVKSTFLGIVNVSENLSRMEKAYRSCLGRVPDRSADWDRLYEIVLDKPFPLEELCVDLARSPEFLQKLEKLDAPSQVEYLYLHLLGRPADAQGRKFWMETLHKIGLQQTIIEFTKSSDFSREFERRLKREGLEG